MRLKRNEILSKMCVFRELEPYGSEQWAVFSDKLDASCTAQVRASSDGEQIEADIMVTYNEPRPNMPAYVQIMWFKAELQPTGFYVVKECRIQNENKVNSCFEWTQKSMRFFALTVQQLEQGNLPDFKDIADVAFKDEGQWADMWGDGGGRQPKFKSEMMMKTSSKGF